MSDQGRKVAKWQRAERARVRLGGDGRVREKIDESIVYSDGERQFLPWGVAERVIAERDRYRRVLEAVRKALEVDPEWQTDRLLDAIVDVLELIAAALGEQAAPSAAPSAPEEQ
jgi:hypothetical protein